MTVRELREALARVQDEDTQVVIGPDPRDWVKPTWTSEAVVDLGRVKERVFFVGCPELPAEESDDDCSECDRLRDVIDEVRRVVENA